ncbi:SPASM domain-containing protein [Chloroflexota bacterium]
MKKHELIEKHYVPCKEVYQKLSVDWDGKVTGCCGDYNNYLTVGNANSSTLYDIWNHSRELIVFRELLDKSLHQSLTLCSTCYHTYEEF